jgi:hypothetical protein
MTRIAAFIAALSFVVAALLSPSAAQASPNPNAVYSIKNSPVSRLNISVQFWYNNNSGAYLDTVPVGATEGEGGNDNVFSEPIRWRLAPNWCGRVRTWSNVSTSGGYTNVGAWSSWHGAPVSQYPNGRWFDLSSLVQKNSIGRYLYEVQIDYCPYPLNN